MNKRRLLQITTLSLSLFALPVIAQQILHVNINNGDDANDGLKWSTAFKNIQPAIDAAVEGDIINVAAGTYYPTKKVAEFYGKNSESALPTTDTNRSFLLTKNLKLYGGYPANASDATTITDCDWTLNPTILSGDFDDNDGSNFENMDENALHVIVMINPTSETQVDGFHITGGGGEESKYIATVYVENTPVDQRSGGGIYIYSDKATSPVLSNLVINHNKASLDGGGIYYYANEKIDASASPVLNNVSIINNQAKNGGGFYNNAKMEAKPILQNVIIAGNEATSEGGGFSCISESGECSPVLENVLISGNKAKNLAGMFLYAMETNANPVITNTTVCGNSANERNTTGGVYIVATGNVSPFIQNTVIWGNKGTLEEYNNIAYWSQFGSINPTYSYSMIEGMDLGETNLNGDTDPMFVNPVDANFAPTTSDFGNYQLLPTSPLINRGNNTDVTLSYDLNGDNRIYGDIVDIGAYEAQNIDLVDNEIIIADKFIWSHQDNLYIKINSHTATVRVYSPNGTLIRQINNLGEGTHALSLPSGLYFVTLDMGETAKIFIR